ncbi:MAG TPA: hypothetical protein VH188_03570 [Chthoniobacterales bacterium]|jgi:hypothetical protein|nr:hypothetical protein [Chthoniobacterales bacterium]
MTFDKFYPVLRTILGDEQIHGLWNYANERLDSAIRSVFLLGRGPSGFALSNAQDQVNPDPPSGDPFALICYDACLLLIGGEDGAMRIHTREISITDDGHRKRDLLLLLRQQIYEVRDGAAVFSTVQNFEQFIHSIQHGSGWPLNLTTFEANVGPTEISI